MWTTDANGRIVPQQQPNDYAEYKAKLLELESLETLITREVANGRMDGLAANRMYKGLQDSIQRFKLPQEQGGSRPPFRGRRGKAGCMRPKLHRPGCQCREMALAQVAKHREGEDVGPRLAAGVTIEDIRHLDLQRS